MLSPATTCYLVVAMVPVEVLFLAFFFFIFLVVLVVSWCANATVPVSSDRPKAAIMSFFMVLSSSFVILQALCASNLVSQNLGERVLK